jgi:hypothetical protein
MREEGGGRRRKKIKRIQKYLHKRHTTNTTAFINNLQAQQTSVHEEASSPVLEMMTTTHRPFQPLVFRSSSVLTTCI